MTSVILYKEMNLAAVHKYRRDLPGLLLASVTLLDEVLSEARGRGQRSHWRVINSSLENTSGAGPFPFPHAWELKRQTGVVNLNTQDPFPPEDTKPTRFALA